MFITLANNNNNNILHLYSAFPQKDVLNALYILHDNIYTNRSRHINTCILTIIQKYTY